MKYSIWTKFGKQETLTYGGEATRNEVENLDHDSFSQWLVTWWHQSITWNTIELYLQKDYVELRCICVNMFRIIWYMNDSLILWWPMS